MDDLLKAVPRYELTLFERGSALVVVVWALISIVRWRRVGWRSSFSRSVPEALIAVGVVGVWAFTVAPDKIFLPGNTPEHTAVNLIPILPLISGFTAAGQGWWLNGPNLAANLVLYAPIGFGLRWRFGLRVWWITLIAAAGSTAVEVSQAVSDQMRTPDINDVILNTVGATVGAWSFMALSRIVRPRRGLRPAAAGTNRVS